jgi:hypothetical protein
VRKAGDIQLDRTAVQQDPFLACQRLAKLGATAVDNDTTFRDPVLDLAPRADAGIG